MFNKAIFRLNKSISNRLNDGEFVFDGVTLTGCMFDIEEIEIEEGVYGKVPLLTVPEEQSDLLTEDMTGIIEGATFRIKRISLPEKGFCKVELKQSA